jgi:hypothetical protein
MQALFIKIKALHKLLLLLQVIAAILFLVVVYVPKNSVALIKNDANLQIVFLCVAIGCHFGGKHFFKVYLQKARNTAKLEAMQKLEFYKRGALIQWVLLTNASILGAICFFLTHNLAYLGVTALVILYFYLLQPNKFKLGIYLGIVL